jgi:uncharacterized membrane protein YkgB
MTKGILGYWRQTLERQGIAILRVSVGLVFLWFGLLKFFDDSSPAEAIATRTIGLISAGAIGPKVSLPMLAALECLIGIGILAKKYMKYVIPLLYFQMAGTILPLFCFPDETWKIFPVIPTLLGQYIIKNTVLASAAIILGAASKGGKLIADPSIARKAKAEEEQRL